MTMDEATTPDRPDGVPAGAGWDEEETGWTLGATGERGKTGEWRCWRADGTFAESSHWVDGKMHGPHIRYHDDGSVASEGPWEDGKRTTMVLHRADTPSQETVMAELPESIRRLVQDFDENGYFFRQRFYTAAGSEVDFDGEPIPPRPAGVPEDAQHAARHRHWYHQRYEPGGEERKIGLHRFWETDGRFKGAEYYTVEGKLVAQINTASTCQSNPLVDAELAGDERAVEECLALGLGSSQGAALHAASVGRSALALRLLGGEAGAPRAEFTDPRGEPERLDGVPGDAVWIAGLKSWAVGEVDPATGAALGTWRLWKDLSFGEAQVEPIVVEFRDGRPARRREWVAWRHEWPAKEWTYGPDGTVLLYRKYDRGRPQTETEALPESDGAVAERRFYQDGPVRVERTTRDDALVSEVWFDADGTRLAEVVPSDVLVDDEPVEWWRGLDVSGAVIAEGAVRPGLQGEPVGRWKLYGVDGPDGTERAVTDFEGLEVQRGGDLGQFAHAVHTWRTTPLPDVLAGVDDIEWTGYETFFGGGEAFAFLIKGLAVPDPLASGHALGAIWDTVLHQHTVSEIAGPALRFVIALAEARPEEEDLLNFLLHVVTRDGGPDHTRQLKELHAAAAGVDDPAEFYGENHVEPAYYEIYTRLGAATPAWARLAAGGPGISREAQQTAFHLLAAAPGEAAAAALRDRLAAEAARDGDERDRENLGDLLLCLGLTPGDETRALVEPFLGDKDPLLAFCAALTWVRIGGNPLPDALPLLISTLGDTTGLDGYGAHWFAEGTASADALDVLSQLPPEHSQGCLDEMCALLDGANSFTAPSLARSLLDIVFPEEAYQDGAPLTADQRRVVLAVAGHAGDGGVINVDVSEVLRYNNLPHTAELLRALCEQE
ncbi:toxin-antitoxin system YwqK family antitoxin [Streptomyces sp. NPDC094448]|uniref:toxin-antitoxin system YwqK family antitoxin n=1 Tax=Streptomyces sp. NPDC094448 TaxID=3366063 RepID=UPI0037FEACAF